MLILTRRAGENVVVGDDIIISVIEVRGDAVRIGIEAPRSLAVHREEVWLELQKANTEAASPSDAAIGATLDKLRNRPSTEKSGKPPETST